MIKQGIINTLMTIVGNVLLAIGTALFILPFNIDNGGLTGIAIILQDFFDPGTLILILNWIIFFIGLIVLKKEFALKTLVATIVYPLVLNILIKTNISNTITSTVDPLLAAIIGSGLIGLGLGIAYRAGASSGGFDIIFIILNKYKGIKISVATFITDFIIVSVGLFTVSLDSALYGIICVVITSYLIEYMMIRSNSSYMMHIISDKSKEINEYIINELKRGSTIIKVCGGINNEEKEMIELIFNEHEYYKVKQKIRNIDKDAFISVYKAVNVYGNGFNELVIGDGSNEKKSK